MQRNENFAEAFRWLKRNKGIRFQKTLAERIGVSDDTITRVLRGYTEPTDDFLDKFNMVFGDVFNYQWLRGNSDTMLARDVANERQQNPEGRESIIELYAQLIKEVESIRRDLNEQMAYTRQLNETLAHHISRLESLSAMPATVSAPSSLNYVRGGQVGLIKPYSPSKSQPSNAAEPSDAYHPNKVEPTHNPKQ